MAAALPGDSRVIDRFDGGVGWIAQPDETMRRASHALSTPSGIWLVDPVDCTGLEEFLESYGEVAGVVVLLDRHRRDAATLARRHDVSVWIPTCIDGVAAEITAPVERFRRELADTGYVVRELIDRPGWQETFLYHAGRNVLVVPETLGTASYFTTGDRPVGVHPVLRLRPPQAVRKVRPGRLLVGHGAGVHENVPAHIDDAIEDARRRTPQLAVETLKELFR